MTFHILNHLFYKIRKCRNKRWDLEFFSRSLLTISTMNVSQFAWNGSGASSIMGGELKLLGQSMYSGNSASQFVSNSNVNNYGTFTYSPAGKKIRFCINVKN